MEGARTGREQRRRDLREGGVLRAAHRDFSPERQASFDFDCVHRRILIPRRPRDDMPFEPCQIAHHAGLLEACLGAEQ